MFNFASVVVFSLLFLGFGFVVGNARQFGLLKFLFLVIFLVPSLFLTINSKIHLVLIGGAFMLGVLYAHSNLFEGFFYNYNKMKSKINSFKEKEKKEQTSRKEKSRNQNDDNKTQHDRYKQEQKRRAEEARQRREEQKETSSPEKRTNEQILGLKPGYSRQDLKEAYRRESARCHPDKWQGKPEHIQKMMSEEQKLINSAYNTLK